MLSCKPEEIVRRFLTLFAAGAETMQSGLPSDIHTHMHRWLHSNARKCVQYVFAGWRKLCDATFAPPAVFASSRARRRAWREDKLAVFVAAWPRAREAKLGQALIRRGWRVVLLYQHEPNYPLSLSFNAAHKFRGKWEALFRASRYAATVYHVFSLLADPASLMLLERKLGPTVFEPNDVFPGLIRGLPASDTALQEECLHKAPALCCRDLQVAAYESKRKVRLTGRRIWFPDLCANLPPVRPHAGDAEIHVVNVGYIPDELFESGGAFPVVKALAEKSIHVHLYANFLRQKQTSHELRARYHKFFQLAETTGHVHVHGSVPLDQLRDEMPRYDFGLLLHQAGPSIYDPEHFRCCGSSREADYLEAGLGVIASRALAHQRFIARRYTVVIDADEVFKSDIRERLVAARQQLRSNRRPNLNFTVNAQISRLERFYERVGLDANGR